MFGKLAHLMYRRRWYVIGVWLLVLVAAGSLAAQVSHVLGPGDFVQKGSDSAKASALLDTKFHQNELKVTLVVMHAANAGVGDVSFRHAAGSVAARIRADRGMRVSYLDNPLVSGNRQLISRDGHSAAILVSSNLEEQKIEGQIDHLRSVVRTPGFTTYVTGTPAMNHDYAVSSAKDLSKSDSITIPILILILLLVFGTLVASALPLILAIFSIALSLAAVYVIGHYLDTSIYVVNVVTFLGLGIGIDYTLFIVYRFREELQAGRSVESAVVRTMETTGRAVFFSGLTVAIGLSSLILTQVPFMQSMGLGGILVPVTSLLVAMTLLPAVLGTLGGKVNRLRLVPSRFLRTGESGSWHRLATAIMKRPVLTGGLVLVIMLALAFPVTQLNFAFGGLKNSPKNIESVAGVLYMQQHFPTVPEPNQVIIQHHGAGTLLSASELQGMRAFENAIRRDSEVVNVSGPADLASGSGTLSAAQQRQLFGRNLSPDGQTAIISVIARHDVGTKAAEDLVRRIRTMAPAYTTGALASDAIFVGGAQASYTDFNDALYAHFPLIVAGVLILTYIFLFWAFRSVFLPLKAVLLNLLSVGTAYGVLQLVFQRGVGSSILGFSPESGVAGWVPIFLFAFLFGLSMDYEVFLLSRIREGWLATGDNTSSVAFGLEKTGKLITSAAAVMVIAFSGFLIGSQLQLKEFGFGLLAAIALDASLIRIILVPSILELMGELNWWVPSFLRSFAAGGATFGEAQPVRNEETELASA